jgi:aspartate aminotransferase
MPILSSRSLEIQESPIRKLAPYADQAKKENVRVYHLNIGQPDIKTPVNMCAAYEKIPDVIPYGPSAGLLSYRKKLSEFYQNIANDISSDNIFITTGGSEAIIFSLISALSPGDEIIIPEPYYTNYNGFAVMAGVKVIPITTHIRDGFDLPSVDAFKEKLTSKTRAVLFSNPVNPTGAVFSRKRLEELIDFIKENDLYIISDEAYREFSYGDRKAYSILEFDGIEDNAIMIDSVSKRYSACGARIGCIVSRNMKLLDLVLKFGQARLCPPTIDQLAAEAAVDTPVEYFEVVLHEYKSRRDFAYNSLSSIPGVNVERPDGAFYMIAELPVEDAEKFSQWLLTDFRLKGSTTMLAPASGFYGTPGLGQNQVRLAYVLNIKELGKAIEIIRVGLDVYKNLELES